jgi:hypothetical protein
MNIETANRNELEQTAEKAMIVFGSCLEQIKKRELYQPEYGTFEAYLSDFWGRSIHWYERRMAESRWADRMMNEYGVALANGNAARKLASIDNELLPAVIKKATQLARGDTITGAHVSAVVRTLVDVIETNHVDIGDGQMAAVDAAITVEYTETLLRQKQHAIEGAKRKQWSEPVSFMWGRGAFQTLIPVSRGIRDLPPGTRVEYRWRIVPDDEWEKRLEEEAVNETV